MSNKIDISAAIVLFNEDITLLNKTISSFLNIPYKKKLFLIDNSPSNILESEFDHPEISYSFMNENIGFGRGHNSVLNKVKDSSSFHLILNPDVEFDTITIAKLIEEIIKNKEIAMIAPKVTYPNGEFQYTCREYPNFLEMMCRRMKVFKNYYHKKEYRNRDLTLSFYPDVIHGCFMLFRTKDFVSLGGFDERYFLYMEDVDICRKIDQIGKKKQYYPNAEISHVLNKESSKKIHLFFSHLVSSFKYFKKWGF